MEKMMEDTVTNGGPPAPHLHDYKQAVRDEAAKVIKAFNKLIGMTQEIVGSGLDTNDLIRVFYETREQHEGLDESRKRFNAIIAELGSKTLPERFQAEGIKTVKLEDVGRVNVAYRKSASLVDKVAGMEWLRENHPDIITETVNAQTLAAFVSSEFIEKNMDPPEFVKYSTSPYTSITKG